MALILSVAEDVCYRVQHTHIFNIYSSLLVSTTNCTPGELLPVSQGRGSLPNNTQYITLRIEYCNNISVSIPVCRNALESIIQDLCSSLLPGNNFYYYYYTSNDTYLCYFRQYWSSLSNLW